MICYQVVKETRMLSDCMPRKATFPETASASFLEVLDTAERMAKACAKDYKTKPIRIGDGFQLNTTQTTSVHYKAEEVSA